MSPFPEKKYLSLEDFTKSYAELLAESVLAIDFNILEKIVSLITDSANGASTIYTCGNGGSSSIAEHLVCDFVKGISTNTDLQPRVFSLLSTPILTATANDISYDEVFSFQIEKYGKENDLLVCVSSSGNSENILRVIRKAKSMGISTISFVGFDGGKVKEESDLSVHVKVDNYGLAEDAHHMLMHILAQFIRLKSIQNSEDISNIKF
tara:strand:- start:1676 stop:2299 length:624 start_codon:yes stop_codon:yes gene_type:complete